MFRVQLLNRTTRFFIFSLLLIFGITSWGIAQADLIVSASETEIRDNGSYDFLIPATIDTLVYPSISFSIRGGDGGRAKLERELNSNPQIPGGKGATVDFDFTLGYSLNKLRPGGTIRFIVGEQGENCNTGSQCGGGGGGGTAVLYLEPGAVIPANRDSASLAFSSAGVNHRPDHWILLAVAGGGGGGAVNQVNQLNEYTSGPGAEGNATNNGSSSGQNGENEGGIFGEDGEDSERSTGGKGYRSAGWEEMAADETYFVEGGSGYGSGGSAERSRAVAGGGGGFSGGGAGENTFGGGGAGFFAIPGSFNLTIRTNGRTNSPNDGFIRYQFIQDGTPGLAPTANCVDDFTVNLTGGEDLTITPADLDDGSSDPAGFDLTYEMCQTADGSEYFCRDSKTWDCGDVGRNQPWFLAVSNGYQTSYCGMTISIREERAEPTCPLSGRTFYDLDGSCTQALTGAELMHLNTLDCENNFPDVTLLLPDNSRVDDPAGFFTSGYTFEDGLTTLIYETEGGSCAFAIEVTADPSFIPIGCPEGQTIVIGAGECEATVPAADLALGYDGPGVISYSIEPETGIEIIDGTGQVPTTAFGRGRNFIRYSVVEPGGCENNCVFTIDVEYTADNEIDFACQDASYPFSLDIDFRNFREGYLAGLVRATDDCGEAPVSLALGYLVGCVAAGTTQEVRLSVGNGDFMQTCSFQLTLTEPDITPSCPANFLQVSVGESGVTELTPEMVANWTDSEGNTASIDVTSVDCSDVGSAQDVTVTLTDECDNTDNCTRQIRVRDGSNPTIVCQDITRALDANGEVLLSYGDLVASVTDNCDIDNLTFELTQSVFTCSDLGVTRNFVSVEDEGGNRRTCSGFVTIVDQTPPSLTCKDATIELGEDGTYRLAVDDVVASFSDNCTGGFSYSQGNFSCDDLANSPISIEVRYRDVGNNTTVCNSLITIIEPECPCLGNDGILVIDNPEDVILCEDLTVEGVRFVEGNLFLNGFTLTVENTGRIQNEGESKFTDGRAGGKILAVGIAEFQDDLMTEIGLTLNNLSDDIRLERLERSSLAVEIDGFPSISRVITVEESFSPPSDNARFHYLDAELNDLEEDELGLYLEQNGVWEFVPALSHNTTDNYFEFALDFSQLTDPVRFTVTNAAALPLDLLTFTGRTESKTNLLEWTTVNEEGFSHFEVERSADGVQWQELGAVAGAGEVVGAMEYGFVDNNPPALSYYRLRMVDLDGSFTYSSVVRLDNQSTAVELIVNPNPSNGQFQVALTGEDGPFNLALYTIHGTRVRAQKVLSGILNWAPEGKLSPGVYLLVATSDKGTWTKQIIIR